MNVIYKYTLEVADYQEISLPIGSRILTVQTQNDRPCVWVIVNTLQDMFAMVGFRTICTGQEFDIDVTFLRHIGTYQLENGRFVAHVFTKDYTNGF